MNERTDVEGIAYLATPYSHPNPEIQEWRFRRVNKVAARLMRDGAHIFSPISHTHPIAVEGDLPKDFRFWEAYDRAILAFCSRVIVLRQEGWQQSIGVQSEIAIAKELGIPVEYIDE